MTVMGLGLEAYRDGCIENHVDRTLFPQATAADNG